jgi:hypothetical protein
MSDAPLLLNTVNAHPFAVSRARLESGHQMPFQLVKVQQRIPKMSTVPLSSCQFDVYIPLPYRFEHNNINKKSCTDVHKDIKRL